MVVLATWGSIVIVHDNSVLCLVENVCGSKSWSSNDPVCSLCHCVLLRNWATKQPWAYSRNGNSIFTETESSVSAPVPPENTVLFLFLFPHKKFHFHFHFANFRFRFHISSPFPYFLRKSGNFPLHFHPYIIYNSSSRKPFRNAVLTSICQIS